MLATIEKDVQEQTLLAMRRLNALEPNDVGCQTQIADIQNSLKMYIFSKINKTKIEILGQTKWTQET